MKCLLLILNDSCHSLLVVGRIDVPRNRLKLIFCCFKESKPIHRTTRLLFSVFVIFARINTLYISYLVFRIDIKDKSIFNNCVSIVILIAVYQDLIIIKRCHKIIQTITIEIDQFPFCIGCTINYFISCIPTLNALIFLNHLKGIQRKHISCSIQVYRCYGTSLQYSSLHDLFSINSVLYRSILQNVTIQKQWLASIHQWQ